MRHAKKRHLRTTVGALIAGAGVALSACTLIEQITGTADPATPAPAPMDAGTIVQGGGAGVQGAAGRGGSSGNAGNGGNGGTALIQVDAGVADDCDFEGSRCEEGLTRLCSDGKLIASQNCQLLGCRDETSCRSPGAGSSVASTSSGLTGVAQGCNVFPAGSCGVCLNNQCCQPAQTCDSDPNCVALWECLADCANILCESSCASSYPAGVDKAVALLECAESSCAATCQQDPCENFPLEWGYACGSNLSPNADPNALYLCDLNKTMAGAVSCEEGCHAGALGEPDYCNDPDPCSNNPYNGAACGGNLATPFADPNVLYECNGGRTVAATPCVVCYAAPPGAPDECYTF